MNIFIDSISGHITGVVDWTDAIIEPFGMALWGTESVLGCSGPNGWSYFGNDPSQSRALFWKTFLREIGHTILDECHNANNEVSTLGVLLRYGFRWGNGMMNPVKDTRYLDALVKDELKLAEEQAP